MHPSGSIPQVRRVRGKARNSTCEWIRFMMLDHTKFFIFLPLNLFVTRTEDCYNAGLPEEACAEYLKLKFLEILMRIIAAVLLSDCFLTLKKSVQFYLEMHMS